MEKYFDSQFERILSLTVRKGLMVDDYMVEGTDSWYSSPPLLPLEVRSRGSFENSSSTSHPPLKS